MGSESRRGRRGPGGARRGWLIDGLHLGALWALAVAQPLFDVLARDAAFFAVRRASPGDIVVTALVLALGPVALFVALEFVLGRLGESIRRAAHRALVGVLLALIAAPLVKRGMNPPAGVAIGISAAAGVVLAIAYAKWGPARSFLTVLSPAPLVTAVVFLLDPTVSRMLRAEPSTLELPSVESDTTLVLLILDELPLGSLLAPDHSIDAEHFPNFARLAADATWYRNYTASHPSTEKVIPCILTGQEPSKRGLVPTAADHPHSLFALLGGSYRTKVWETKTSVCPARLAGGGDRRGDFASRMEGMASDLSVVYGHIALPESLVRHLPPVSDTWGDFAGADVSAPSEAPDGQATWRSTAFRQFVGSLDESSEPTLYFLHVMLPHKPWEYLHDGKRYRYDADAGLLDAVWGDDERLVHLAFQRYLLQLSFVDTLLGELLDRMHAVGLYDRSLLVVMADHGATFRAGERRRRPTDTTLQEILRVPLFVKRPFQSSSGIDDRNVESIDILPSVAHLLGIELPWPVEGRAVLDDDVVPRTDKRIWTNHGPMIRLDDVAVPSTWPALDLRRELFGDDFDWGDVYTIGPHRELVGRRVASLRSTSALDATARLARAPQFTSAPAAGETPGLIEGEIHAMGEWRAPPDTVAIAVNGVVRGVGPTHDVTSEGAAFSVLVPGSAFAAGPNEVEAYALLESGYAALVPQLTYAYDGKRFLRSDGREFAVGEIGLDGRLSVADLEDDQVVLRGWAGATEERRAADAVLVVIEGKDRVFPATVGRYSRALAAKLGEDHPVARSAFRSQLSLELFDGTPGGVRAFAILDDRAQELEPGPRSAWVSAQ